MEPTAMTSRDVNEQIVEMYQSGDHTVDQIVEATGKSRSTIYYQLRAAGISPARQKNSNEQLQMLLDRNQALMLEKASLVDELADVREQLARANAMIDMMHKLGSSTEGGDTR